MEAMVEVAATLAAVGEAVDTEVEVRAVCVRSW